MKEMSADSEFDSEPEEKLDNAWVAEIQSFFGILRP